MNKNDKIRKEKNFILTLNITIYLVLAMSFVFIIMLNIKTLTIEGVFTNEFVDRVNQYYAERGVLEKFTATGMIVPVKGYQILFGVTKTTETMPYLLPSDTFLIFCLIAIIINIVSIILLRFFWKKKKIASYGTTLVGLITIIASIMYYVQSSRISKSLQSILLEKTEESQVQIYSSCNIYMTSFVVFIYGIYFILGIILLVSGFYKIFKK